MVLASSENTGPSSARAYDGRVQPEVDADRPDVGRPHGLVVALVVAGLLSLLMVASQASAVGTPELLFGLFSIVLQIGIGWAFINRPAVALLCAHVVIVGVALVGENAFLSQVPTYLPLAFHLGRRSTMRRTAVVGLVVLASFVPLYVEYPHPQSPLEHERQGLALTALSTGTLLIVLPALVGQRLRWESQRLSMAMRLVQAERQQTQVATEQAVRAERARMARELHDIAAHHMTAVAIDARAARRLLVSKPEEIPDFLDEIVKEASDATKSLREVVGLLDDSHARGAESAPQPTLAQLSGLVEQARRRHPDIQLVLDPTMTVPTSVGLATFRIVQESLTNTHRYAPGAQVRVVVEQQDDVLLVDVRDNGTGRPRQLNQGWGLGLTGMRSRAEGLGGQFEAGPDQEGWRVTARLPLGI